MTSGYDDIIVPNSLQIQKVIHVKELCLILYYNRAEFEAILNYYDLYEHSDLETFLQLLNRKEKYNSVLSENV